MTEHSERAIKLIASLVRDARISKGLSQRQLSELAGVDYKTLGSFERAERMPRDVNLAKIEAALGWRKGSIERSLDEGPLESLESLTVADMEGGAATESWEDLAESNGTYRNGPVHSARLLSDEDLIAELSYRFRNYHTQVHGDSPWKRPHNRGVADTPDN